MKKLPVYLTKYFWGDDLGELSWDRHKKYITKTILEKGDKKAIGWLFDKSRKSEIRQCLPEMKLSPKSYNYWNLFLR